MDGRSRTLRGVRYQFRSELWIHTGEAAWHFVTLPLDVAEEIAEITEGVRRGFGSVRVVVTIGATTWSTSIFPDSPSRSFVLPVKKEVRVAEGIDDGSPVDVTLELEAPLGG